MSYITIYHGSESVIKEPIYKYSGSNINNDYGLGFYTTKELESAKEWANRKTTSGFVNKYYFDNRGMKILDLTDKNKYSVLNWIAILIHNRKFEDFEEEKYKKEFEFLNKYYIDVSLYDVVIGYRADDAYFRFPRMFIDNNLTLEKLEEIYLLGDLGTQYVLISEKAFKHIKFIKYIEVESKYHDKYKLRIDIATKSYNELEIKERYSKGKRIRDLIGESND